MSTIKAKGYKIEKTYAITQAYELSVNWNGFNFLIIYGKHKNGWFIAIPNWNICTEAGEPEDDCYNTTKLAKNNIHEVAPYFLAQAIKKHWEGIKNDDNKRKQGDSNEGNNHK